MKFKRVVIKKYYKGDCYKFINGVARVPGMWHKLYGGTTNYTITLKEFKELTNE